MAPLPYHTPYVPDKQQLHMRTHTKWIVIDDLFYNFIIPFNPSRNESLPLSFIMTSFCLIRMIITDVGKISYSCLSRSAFIKVSAYGQIGRNSIINFLHSLSRCQTRSKLEHTVDCAQLIPAWERTCVLNI